MAAWWWVGVSLQPLHTPVAVNNPSATTVSLPPINSSPGVHQQQSFPDPTPIDRLRDWWGLCEEINVVVVVMMERAGESWRDTPWLERYADSGEIRHGLRDMERYAMAGLLLIWEECHFKQGPSSESPFSEWEGCSQLLAQSGDNVRLLINKMMVNNHVSLVGEGIIGRAAFTGNHQWIVSDNYIKDAHPPEVRNQLQQQFAGGMKTVVVIPVLPHGVVQLGSSFSIMENVPFVNDVKSLVLQLGCVPGALLSDNYDSAEKIGIPISLVTSNPSQNFNLTNKGHPLMSDDCVKQTDTVQSSRLVDQSFQAVGGYPLDNLNTTKSHNNHFEESLCSEMIPNVDKWLKQQSSYGLKHDDHTRVACDGLKSTGQQNVQDHVNSFITSQMETGRGIILNSHGQPVSHRQTSMDTQNGLHSLKQKADINLFQAFEAPLCEKLPHEAKYESACVQSSSGDDLFDILGMDFKNKLLNGCENIFLADGQYTNMKNSGLDTLVFANTQDTWADMNGFCGYPSDSGIYSEMDSDNLLDAVVSRSQSSSGKQILDDNLSCKTTLTKISNSSVPSISPTFPQGNISNHKQAELLHKSTGKAVASQSSSFQSGCSRDNVKSSTSIYGSQISSLFEHGQNIKRENSVSTGYSKKNDEANKSNRKRLKPGENPRPRPKDRQMIQDRVKELREIIPSGAKCSIDALLERTIKHMLFLQSVTKHADKLKQTGESKIISEEGGLLLKDNFEGGATWAFEVGSQSMVCPIIVEDLNPPRQMLVEMLCEERGFFLEIADLVRGLGLTILKGVMEARNDKIWARFVVEANRDVTRMEIFMSLVRLLEQTIKGSTSSSANDVDVNNMISHHSFPQAASIPATGRPSSLQ
ncbi:hypothetical protein ACFE04_012236 [Oxalis oulophora]